MAGVVAAGAHEWKGTTTLSLVCFTRSTLAQLTATCRALA